MSARTEHSGLRPPPGCATAVTGTTRQLRVHLWLREGAPMVAIRRIYDHKCTPAGMVGWGWWGWWVGSGLGEGRVVGSAGVRVDHSGQQPHQCRRRLVLRQRLQGDRKSVV